MANFATLIASIVPYNPAIDSPLGHRNLILIYVFVWGGQFAYGAYVIYKWRKVFRIGGITSEAEQKIDD